MSDNVNECDGQRDEHYQPKQNNDEMINFKAWSYEIKKTKNIMHLTRNKKGCKKIYGKEFDSLKTEQAKARREYKN